MNTLTDVMKEFVQTELAYVATVDSEGNPNIGPKRTCRLLSDTQIIFSENTGGQTYKNIQENGKIALAYANRQTLKGFRFVGKATIHTDEEHIKIAHEKSGIKPKIAAIVVDIEKIYLLDSGPKAGTLIS